MTDFATELAGKIRAHDRFWHDYRIVRARGARASLPESILDGDSPMPEEILQRVVFSASVFAQSDHESDHALAQSIALSALFVSERPEQRGSSTALLALLGNFPGVKYLQSTMAHAAESESSDPLEELQIRLLETLNTVRISGVDQPLTDFQMGVWARLPQLAIASISAPTSAGKSFVVIEYLCKQMIERESFSAVYVAPTRALLSEVSRKIVKRLKDVPDVHVSTVPAIDPTSKPKQLYVLTQERLSALLSVSTLSPDILIVDEAQNLADGARGMILQDCIERVKERSPSAQVLMLSPSTTGFPSALRTLGIQETEVRETSLSPVLQNRILVHAVAGKPYKLRLSLLEKGGETPMGFATTKRGVDSTETRLATVALELGGGGGALVYATGAADAEKVAARLVLGLARAQTPELADLSDFIRTHIHKDYGLAEAVLHGVAFHYGKMPALLREALEDAFEKGQVTYLVCTTTLFQGVNLPARNVFINTPTRGTGTRLDPALLWNFAGRAGRLSKDVVGNVFLVDYDNWEDKPLDQMVRLEVKPSLARTLSERHLDVIGALEGQMPKNKHNDDSPAEVRAAAGYLLARASRGTLDIALERFPNLEPEARAEISYIAKESAAQLNLPSSILEANWTIDPFGLSRLKRRLSERVSQDLLADLIPCDPHERKAFGVYAAIFNMIAVEVLQQKAITLGAFVANYATQWMKGIPYPVLVSKWVKRKTNGKATANIDGVIRGAFEFIEDELRFKWVQLGRAYIDVLNHVLQDAGKQELREKVFDFSLALELGVSTRTARSFIELGLSRIAAATLSSLYPDSQLTATEARSALREANIAALPISPVIVRELASLGLINNRAGAPHG